MDLNGDAFQVSEDRIPVDIVQFGSPVKQSVSAVLVVDHSASMGGAKIQGARDAARRFVAMMREDRDAVGLVAFNENVRILEGLTTHKTALHSGIDSIQAYGNTAYYSAVYEAIALLGSASGRRAVIALTDGMDNSSYHSMDQAIKHARDNQVALYTIGLGGWRDLDQGGLQRMSKETGGEYHRTPSASELGALYRRIAEELQNEYLLGYKSPTPRLDGTQRDVAVTVQHSGATLTVAKPYSVGGILALSINPALLLAMLLALLLLLVLPTWLSRRKARLVAPTEGPLEIVPAAPPDEPSVAWLIGKHRLVKDTVTIGRAEASDIPLAHPSVSDGHALIKLEGDRYVIQDLGSENGTFVSYSGDPTAELQVTGRNALKNGSRLRFGRLVCVLTQPAEGAAELLVHYPLSTQVTTIGRDVKNDIILLDETVSAQHTRIDREAGRYVVSDLGSAAGTFVSFTGDPTKERRIAARNALKNGSTVRLGEVTFTLKISESP